jgi:hypothetical protein
VVCRFRPFNQRELSEIVANQDQFKIIYDGTDVVDIKMPEGEKKFRFDRIFPPETAQVFQHFDISSVFFVVLIPHRSSYTIIQPKKRLQKC